VSLRVALAALLIAASALGGEAAAERTAPIGVGYRPADRDERGLWMQLDAVERGLKTSDFVVRDPALNAYVRRILCRTVGEAQCADVRLYVVRTAEFNATMAPNGMMTVYTGLLLRVRDEAQLAAILGHEFTHYTHRHSLRKFRDAKSKAGTLAWLSAIQTADYGVATAVTLLQVQVMGSLYRFSREMETEADAGSIPLMTAAGYDPGAAAQVWEQLRAEQDATAGARRKRVPKPEQGFFATHPPRAERVAALTSLAAKHAGAAALDRGADGFRAALTSWWPQLLDDQIKLNDFGASDFLLGELAATGWTAPLLYARGELYRTRGGPRDLVRAIGFYRDALAVGAGPDAWRGLGLAALRGGDAQEGRRALSEYLARYPEASDRAMIAMLAGETR
jgi:Zn-dependent protease with chaperone function